ncbi:unnamed protein product [Dibothriocephalus latus]|uniref:Pseudouridine synthase RsuA/RluA-like domain-containing protein n=1 Tax=Dibothriocephalus latus TaxID=60516 RepID=A0A3P7PUZ0_DIBLA|nr:unnamed protein product [Dibothriocephalus latus]
MTSGLILIGKTPESASKISLEISGRNVSKYYVCEVEGKFKGPEQNANDPPAPVIVEQPLGRLSQKMGFPLVDDPLYNSYDWGPTKGAFAKYIEPRSSLIEALAATRSRNAYLEGAVSDVESPRTFYPNTLSLPGAVLPLFR